MTTSGIKILDRYLEDWQAMSGDEMVAYVRGNSNLSEEQSDEIIALLSEAISEKRKIIDELEDDLRVEIRNRKNSEARRVTASELLDSLRQAEMSMVDLDGQFKMAGIGADAWRAEHFINGDKEGPATLANLELGDPVTSDPDDITYTVTLPTDPVNLINIAGYTASQNTEPKEVFLNVEPATLEFASVNEEELVFRVVGEDGKIAYIRIVNWKNGTFFVNQASDLMRDWPPDVLKHMRLSNGNNRSLFEILYGEGALGELAWMEEQIHEEADDREEASREESASRPKRREDLPLLERVENRPLEPHVWRGRKID